MPSGEVKNCERATAARLMLRRIAVFLQAASLGEPIEVSPKERERRNQLCFEIRGMIPSGDFRDLESSHRAIRF